MGNVTRLEYQVVLVTKYRKPALRGIEQAVYAALENATRGQDFEVVQMGCDDGNHVHLAIKAAPTVTVEQVVLVPQEASALVRGLLSQHRGRGFSGKGTGVRARPGKVNL